MEHGPIPPALEDEAAAFDRQIRERLDHGHIPDLRLMKDCDWFRNNVWRRSYLADLIMGRVVRFALAHFAPGGQVLEVGCGPGYLCLELARAGLHMTGIDISEVALTAAETQVTGNPFKENWGSCRYVRADVLNWSPDDGMAYDGVLMFGVLHHFPEPGLLLDHVAGMMKPDGRLIAFEPARDWWGPGDAAILALVRWVLAVSGTWFEGPPSTETREEIRQVVEKTLDEIQESRPPEEGTQSPMDNACLGCDMIEALHQRFEEIAYEPDTLLTDRVVGGMRLKDDVVAQQAARAIQEFELCAIGDGKLSAGGFLFAGKRRG